MEAGPRQCMPRTMVSWFKWSHSLFKDNWGWLNFGVIVGACVFHIQVWTSHLSLIGTSWYVANNPDHSFNLSSPLPSHDVDIYLPCKMSPKHHQPLGEFDSLICREWWSTRGYTEPCGEFSENFPFVTMVLYSGFLITALLLTSCVAVGKVT